MGWQEIMTTSHTIHHGSLTGLSDDDHTIYPLLAGRAGGQTLRGGTGAGDDLLLLSTSHATKGHVGAGGKAGGTDTVAFSVFDRRVVSGAENYYALCVYDSVIGGTTGVVRGLYHAGCVADVGAVNYAQLDGMTGEAYVGLQVNDGAASAAVAYTGLVTMARGTTGAVVNIASGAGAIGTAYGLAGLVANYGATSIIRNAAGAYIGDVHATGNDPANAHNAYGLYIAGPIVAAGGAANSNWVVYSPLTNPSYLNGPLGIGVELPQAGLHIVGDSLRVEAALFGATSRLELICSAAGGRRWDMESRSSGELYFTDQTAGATMLKASGATGNFSAFGTLYPGTGAAMQAVARLTPSLLCLAETTTPGAEADHAKIYSKIDNKLYFQDGAGVEHEIALV